eukprot:c12992_g1_i1.p1 GENE.c12992_g1_i1~~c12992_g1_i1.p1  ORF type:complete len:367 (+),score=56.92 c12992_g1_i1:164-1264(+)
MGARAVPRFQLPLPTNHVHDDDGFRGELRKRSSGRSNSWNKRYFVLKMCRLVYFKPISEEVSSSPSRIKLSPRGILRNLENVDFALDNEFHAGSRPMGEIKFDESSTASDLQMDCSFVLFNPNGKSYVFDAPSQTARNNWVTALNAAIDLLRSPILSKDFTFICGKQNCCTENQLPTESVTPRTVFTCRWCRRKNVLPSYIFRQPQSPTSSLGSQTTSSSDSARGANGRDSARVTNGRDGRDSARVTSEGRDSTRGANGREGRDSARAINGRDSARGANGRLSARVTNDRDGRDSARVTNDTLQDQATQSKLEIHTSGSTIARTGPARGDTSSSSSVSESISTDGAGHSDSRPQLESQPPNATNLN